MWERNSRLIDAINCFTQNDKEWNENQFGNIFSRKKNLMWRLNGIQRVLALRPSDFLVKLENELLRELDIVLNQEKELWALKSRVNWMIQGDRNTNFYHVSTLIRRKRNQIMAIKKQWGIGFMRRGRLRSLLGVVLSGSSFSFLCASSGSHYLSMVV